MKKRLINKTLSRWILLLLMLVTGTTQGVAQNVTISPTTGNLVQVLSTPGETGYAAGFAAFWRHEQLPLTMTVADVDDVTESGECLTPTCAISDYDRNGGYRRLILAGGTMPTYMIVSLPKGYRITGYKIVLRNDLGTSNVSNSTTRFTLTDNTLYFYEVDPWTTGSTNYRDASLSTYKEVAKASDGTTAINVGTASNPGGSDYGKEYTIERYSKAEDGSDMSNQLYFRLTKIFNQKYYGISIKSFEIFFTAKGTFTAEGAPSSINPTAVSVLPVAFNTNKTDIGGLKPTTKDGQTFYTYNYRKVTDLLAFNYLYQEDALKEDAEGKKYPEEGVAGITKKIHQVENGGKKYFGLKNGVYYMETPVTVTNSSGEESPIGYRIVGAKINYAYGADQQGTAAKTVDCIKFVDPSTHKEYYLNADGTYQTTPVEWTADANGIHSGDAYLAYMATGYGTSTIYRLTVGTSSSSNKLTVNDIHDGYIRPNITIGQDGAASGEHYLIGLASSTARPPFEQLNNNPRDDHYNANLRATWTTATIPATSPFVAEEYQIKVYDYKKGKTVQKTIDVTSGTTDSYDLGILNNDAIKFEIAGVDGSNGLALVTVDLTLQALNPYINSMEIVCHDGDDNDPTKPRTMEMSQTFTNDDFSVSGGVFEFYVPERYANENLTFTFSNLYSTDGDETYPNGKGAARYSFVTSDYFENFDGYGGDDGLYSTSYDPESTAAPFRYEDKAFTAVAGNNFFKFNNADELNSSSTGTHPDHLIEYPFTVSKYLASTGSPTGEGTFTQNEFVDVILNASGIANTATVKNSGIFYVFTADETRYNIAKTTAWEHRYYAFYRMDINLKAMTYHSKLEWEKIYDATCYNKDGADAEDSMWGLTLKTVASANSTEEVEGFLTTVEIDNAITAALEAEGDNHPTSTDQILYVDASNLKSVVAIQGAGGLPMETLKARFAPNVLFYLPENSTSTLDNFAYKQDDKFYAAGNIVITDRKPFYAPYDIQTTSPNYATYTREISWPRNGKTALATVILPFQLTVREGVHTEPTGSMYPGSEFTVSLMNSSNCLSITEEELNSANDYYKADAYFSPISGTSTVANKPYMINVTSAPDNENVPFAATQIGALVKATSSMGTNYEFEGEDALGSINGGTSSISFHNQGSFSGKKLTASKGYFYFSGGMYLNSKNLNISALGDALYVYPFRGYYSYEGGGPGNAKMITAFNVLFGENEEATGITELAGEADLVAIPGRGTITFKAAADNDVQIVKANGMKVGRVVIGAGETQTIHVPAGLYIVNGAKLIVK